MKRVVYLLVALNFVCGSCEQEIQIVEEPQPRSLELVRDEMMNIVAAGAEYDADAISWDKYWYLDALLKYNEDYSEVVELLSDIGGKPWLEEFEPVVCITKDKVSRYALTEGGDVVVEQVGDLEFYPRVSKLFVDWKAEDGSVVETFEANFLAYTDDSFVVEWQSEGENFRALFKMIDYEVLENRGADVNRLVARAGEFDAKSVKKRIIGEWKGSVRLEYDYYYTEVCRIHALPGKVYWFPSPPRFNGSYVFHEDGTITHEVLWPGDPYVGGQEDRYVTYHQSWSYSPKSNKMTIVDLGDDWLIWDYDEVKRDYDTNEVKKILHLRDGYWRVK